MKKTRAIEPFKTKVEQRGFFIYSENAREVSANQHISKSAHQQISSSSLRAIFLVHFGTIKILVQFLFTHIAGDLDGNINQLHLDLL